MLSRLAIVSGGDAGYFPLLAELAASIRSIPGTDSVALWILDAGLSDSQVSALAAFNVRIVPLDWCGTGAGGRAAGRDALKCNVAKLHLDRLITGADVILWIDGDAWLQNAHCLDYFMGVAGKGKLAIVSESSQYQTSMVGYRRILGPIVEIRNILLKNARIAGLPASVRRALTARPTLNAGAFALRVDAPHWERLRHWQSVILRKGKIFTSDQLAIGLATYIDGLPYETLPVCCNYMGPWRWDAKRRALVEFSPPYAPVSVVHLAGLDAMRRDAGTKIDLVDMADRKVSFSLRYKLVTQLAAGMLAEEEGKNVLF